MRTARKVPSAASAALRVEVVFVATAGAAEGASYPRLEIEVAAGAELELIERHLLQRANLCA